MNWLQIGLSIIVIYFMLGGLGYLRALHEVSTLHDLPDAKERYRRQAKEIFYKWPVYLLFKSRRMR